ncbi:MAG: hypothetical protein ACR2JM_16055 [Mycobacterium sp.]
MTDTVRDDDESVLEKVDQLVDEVLGTDIVPTEPEDPWEHRQRILDSWTAIILAVAAVATTWASFQASQWANAQSDAQSISAIQRSDANRAASEATSQSVVDSQMWIAWVEAVASGQKDRAGFLRDRFSPALDRSQKEWLGTVAVDAEGNPSRVPDGTPLNLASYVVPSQVQADELSSRAEASLADADEASNTATKYVMLAVLFALVLFFASVATKFTAPKIQVALILTGLVLLVTTCVRMFLLPQML